MTDTSSLLGRTISHYTVLEKLGGGGMAVDPSILYNAACTYGVLSRKAEALATLKKAISAGWGNPNWAARDADLDCLHDDPEFRKLVGLSDPAAS